MAEIKKLTGYPSIDKPWLKYYSDEAINAPLPECTMWQYIYDNNKDFPNDIALRYYGSKTTYGQLFESVMRAASAFWSTMIGYYKNETASRKIMETDQSGKVWIHTGDLGCVDEDGFVFIKGRLKRIYVTTTSETDAMMFKLFPDRIEELFEAQDGVHLCGVIAKPDAKRLNVPVAFVERMAEADSSMLIGILQSVAKKELPIHMQPAAIHVLDAIPMTASGKVDYRALEEMANE